MHSSECTFRDQALNSTRKYRIFMSTNTLYFNIFMNWLAFFNQICDDKSVIYLLCLDAKVERNLRDIGLNCSFTEIHDVSGYGKVHLWYLRAYLTRDLLSSGYDVLMTDSDSIWLSNPFPYLQRFRESHIISQRGVFPPDVSSKLGATLCMGFVYIKSDNLTIRFWNEMELLLMTSKNADDQGQINRYFFLNGLRYGKVLGFLHTVESDTGKFIYTQGQRSIELFKLPAINGTMIVTLLPHEFFRRICEGVNIKLILNSTVAHCKVPRFTVDTQQKYPDRGTAKMKELDSFSLW